MFMMNVNCSAVGRSEKRPYFSASSQICPSRNPKRIIMIEKKVDMRVEVMVPINNGTLGGIVEYRSR